MPSEAPVLLPDGLVLRSATDDDVDAVAALNVAAFGAQDEADVRNFLAQPAIRDAWCVVADGDRVVSSMTRIEHRVQLDGFEFDASQIEYVVTDPQYQRRGLIAAQMDWQHRAIAARGTLLQLIGGIPYFYRRFGYGYGLDAPTLFLFDTDEVATRAARDDSCVRPARADDLEALVGLEAQRPTACFRVVRDAHTWSRMLTRCDVNEHAHLLVAEQGDDVVGWTLLFDHPNERRTFLHPSIARTRGAVASLVQRALEIAGDHLLIGFDSPGTFFGDELRELGAPFEFGHGYYTRIADPVAFLRLVRPVLSARLAASDLASAEGTLELSFYDSGAAIDYGGGEVVDVRATAGEEDPTDTNGIGVAPDAFPALVLGRFGAKGLAERVDDVFIGRDRHLMNVLFPFRPSDIAADF
jgi:predicted N-acetyltransferase YhbS